ncbi:hypothetical protein CORC01_04525 [Colletotrichum orchidophilum]|uniref:NADP-dependent oxidoreductase domain-containing protein n=1 Tax=Colletotrichum orchidophilum TaxID=1209926 RepID=A0A1G4BFM6_9PEZI|nr:uncharacterized protein CORC01_04525 [Colletotrichum orchidophilum]OHF00117.1 hypothetical protein CORC01_04525 [Colletotrichum orchidophilum]
MDEPVSVPGSTATMPRLGLGVYQLRGEECFAACLAGLEAGYRHVDTAQLYGNEAEVGRAVGVYLRRQRQRESSRCDDARAEGVGRQDVFLTTKVGRWEGSAEKMYRIALRSVLKVAGDGGAGAGDGEGEGYVDLVLVHRPVERWREIWSVLKRLGSEGRARAIGVSNFGIEALEEMKRDGGGGGLPCVNQIELHPWCQQRRLVGYCQRNGIVVQAYSPLARGRRMADPVLIKVVERVRRRVLVRAAADNHHYDPHETAEAGSEVTAAQVLIRWSLQRGFVPLPKSGGADRVRENADVFWFRLDGVEMDMLDGLDLGAAGALFPANLS